MEASARPMPCEASSRGRSPTWSSSARMGLAYLPSGLLGEPRLG